MPVVRNFWVTHQWLRELTRFQHDSIVGVYFRIPDKQQVWMGHYGELHRSATAAEAVGALDQSAEPFGCEVLIPRIITTREICKIRSLPQVIGWRYSPQSKGHGPCPCRYCTGGEYGARKLRERLADLG